MSALFNMLRSVFPPPRVKCSVTGVCHVSHVWLWVEVNSCTSAHPTWESRHVRVRLCFGQRPGLLRTIECLEPGRLQEPRLGRRAIGKDWATRGSEVVIATGARPWLG